jgi:hypothetical protein
MASKKRPAPPIQEEDYEQPNEPELERILDEYIELRKATEPSEEAIKAVFAASGGQCECVSSDCEHVGRCPRTLHKDDRAAKPAIGYLQWEALPIAESSRFEIVCTACQSDRYQAERKRWKSTTE